VEPASKAHSQRITQDGHRIYTLGRIEGELLRDMAEIVIPDMDQTPDDESDEEVAA
jgi:hypothetical protein